MNSFFIFVEYLSHLNVIFFRLHLADMAMVAGLKESSYRQLCTLEPNNEVAKLQLLHYQHLMDSIIRITSEINIHNTLRPFKIVGIYCSPSLALSVISSVVFLLTLTYNEVFLK